jgi:hypothetical protein
MIDGAVWPLLRGARAPLFLAGVGSHLPLYRESSRYAFVADRGIEGNVDELDADTLRERAWPLVEEQFSRRRREVLEELELARSRGVAELDLVAIGRHAVQGRVRRLLLGEGEQVSGSFDFETGRIHSGVGKDGLSDDVLDDLAQAVLIRAGEVMTLPVAQMAEGASAAAVLRW